jgi:hypothetical protein
MILKFLNDDRSFEDSNDECSDDEDNKGIKAMKKQEKSKKTEE